MKPTAVIAGLLTSVALAQPHLGHRRRAHLHPAHQKRAVHTEWMTEWVTETVTAYVDESTTEYVLPEHTSAPHTTLSTALTTTTRVPAEFFPSTSAAPQPQQETQPTSHTPVNVPAPAATSAAAAPASSQASSGGSSAANGNRYTGELTYYAIGMGSCGIDDSGKDQTENIVALSTSFMGAWSASNPMCGKTITISYNGVTTTAIVRDTCAGCAANDIDVSEAAFKTIFGSLGVGRKAVDWWFN